MAWQAERGKWRRGRGRGRGSVLQTPGEAKTRGQRTLDLSQWLLVDSDSRAGLIKSLLSLKTFDLREYFGTNGIWFFVSPTRPHSED